MTILPEKSGSASNSLESGPRIDYPRTFLTTPELWGDVQIPPCRNCEHEQGHLYRVDSIPDAAGVIFCGQCYERSRLLTMRSLAALVYGGRA